jgi:protein disulfide-isomerase
VSNQQKSSACGYGVIGYRSLLRKPNFLAGAATLLFVISGSSGCKSGSHLSTLLPSFSPPPLKISPAWHDTFDSAMQESRETGKPVLANFTKSVSCTWCVKLKRDVFETEAFTAWAEEHVVLLNLDFQQPSRQAVSIQQQHQELAARHQIQGYPTVLLLDSQENVLGKLGYMDDPHKWIAKAESFIKAN